MVLARLYSSAQHKKTHVFIRTEISVGHRTYPALPHTITITPPWLKTKASTHTVARPQLVLFVSIPVDAKGLLKKYTLKHNVYQVYYWEGKKTSAVRSIFSEKSISASLVVMLRSKRATG